MAEQSDYERIGGEEGVRRIVDVFLRRVYKDMIIGFFFVEVDKAHLLEREIEFASRHLGGSGEYRGRPLGAAHQPHKVNLGHFHRRLWILEQVLEEQGVPSDVKQRWLEHNRKLVAVVTNKMECMD